MTRSPTPLRLAAAFSLGLLLTSVLSAQNRLPGRNGSRPGSDGSASLQRAGLKIGMPMPNIKIHDEQGREFNTASLKGSYTVLTFGCLT